MLKMGGVDAPEASLFGTDTVTSTANGSDSSQRLPAGFCHTMSVQQSLKKRVLRLHALAPSLFRAKRVPDTTPLLPRSM
jgi:hypothetical protein